MKSNFFLLVACCIFLITNACHDQQSGAKQSNFSIKDAEWMIGAWSKVSEEGCAFEIWTRQNDSALAGRSFFVSGKDTTLSETIILMQSGKQVYLIPTVIGQNDGQAVRFTLTKNANQQLDFENPAHNFPQKISYRKINNDSLCAEISGTEKGQQQAMQFPMGRVR